MSDQAAQAVGHRCSIIDATESPLDALPFPVYFVVKRLRQWGSLIGNDTPPPAAERADEFLTAEDCWTVQTYIQLRRRGLNVHLVQDFVPDEVCVIANEELKIKDKPFHSYVIACRHDRGRPEVCEQRFVQNPKNIIDGTDHLIPHWPQPNLEPRDPNRGDHITSITYKGLPIYLAEPFREQRFVDALRELGLTLRISQSDLKTRFADWTDYSQDDLVLAVRNCTAYDLSIKPASKLVNAWFAGCPALLGPEPAYQALRETELDYIEVTSPAEVLDAVRQLKDDPELYQSMIEHGRMRAAEFTPQRIAAKWHAVLAGPVAEDFARWKRRGAMTRRFLDPVRFAYRAMMHKRERKHHQTWIHRGPRLFPDAA